MADHTCMHVRSQLHRTDGIAPHYNQLARQLEAVLATRPATVTIQQPCVARVFIFLAECYGTIAWHICTLHHDDHRHPYE